MLPKAWFTFKIEVVQQDPFHFAIPRNIISSSELLARGRALSKNLLLGNLISGHKQDYFFL
jgi:hypothetical protein